ncbi:hypothetical protein KIN20_005673 [Parelaphostrongylus tenuis]|uniref:Uncharacterized protein n=1 Tax=Parelaphostrongylus tenuis TaxID=148309 RepID=A0AAD5M2I3_PARTN|nr:hypothetical protein KIN20_005673 [Parelaphostrongylus tenuis]
MQRNLAQAKGDGAKDLIQEKRKQGQRRRSKESAKKVGNRCEQQRNEEVSAGDRKADRHIVQKEEEMISKQAVPLKKDKQGVQQHLSEEVKICSQPNISKSNTIKWSWNIVKDHKIECAEKRTRGSRPIKAGYVEVEGDQSSSLWDTNTLASRLAKDFSTFSERDIAVDLDSVVKEDDRGDLFACPENNLYNIPKQNIRDTTLEADAAEKSFEEKDDTVLLFEPSELRTSTPVLVKNQLHSNKEKSSTQMQFRTFAAHAQCKISASVQNKRQR